MQQVNLELDHDNFFCPVTGFHIQSRDHYAPSPATLFMYVDAAGEIDCYSEALEELKEKVNSEEVVEESEDGLTELERFLAAIKDMQNIVVFAITTCGMACGPVSNTIYLGIDMNYQESE